MMTETRDPEDFMTTKERLYRIIEEMPEETSEDTVELIHKIEGLSESERDEVSRFIESLREPSPLKRHIALMDRIAASIPEEELRKVPADFLDNIDKYAYESD